MLNIKDLQIMSDFLIAISIITFFLFVMACIAIFKIDSSVRKILKNLEKKNEEKKETKSDEEKQQS